jgi:hypothetical protein
MAVSTKVKDLQYLNAEAACSWTEKNEGTASLDGG